MMPKSTAMIFPVLVHEKVAGMHVRMKEAVPEYLL